MPKSTAFSGERSIPASGAAPTTKAGRLQQVIRATFATATQNSPSTHLSLAYSTDSF